jgi:hypothetical protein
MSVSRVTFAFFAFHFSRIYDIGIVMVSALFGGKTGSEGLAWGLCGGVGWGGGQRERHKGRAVREQRAGNRKKRVESREQRSGSREQMTENREQRAEHREYKAGNRGQRAES